MAVHDAYRALIVPFSQEIWDGEAIYTEQGSFTGNPVPGRSTPLRVVGAGTQEPGSELEILVQKGGHPIRGEAGVVWRREGDTNYRGAHVPSIITHHEEVDVIGGTGTHVVSLPSGTRIGVMGTSTAVLVYRSIDGTWDGPYFAATSSTMSTTIQSPCLLVLPDGRVLLFSWVGDGTYLQVQVHETRDEGETWSIHSPAALSESLLLATIKGRRLRAAYSSGQILLIADVRDASITAGSERVLIQYSSDDLGSSFYRAEAGIAAAEIEGALPEVWVHQGRFCVLYTDHYTSTAKCIRGGASAWDVLALYDSEEVLTGVGQLSDWTETAGLFTFNEGEMALAQDPAGTLWVYAQVVSGDHIGQVWRSTDGGVVFEEVGSSTPATTSMWWNTTTTDTTYPKNFSVCAHRGGVLMLCTNSAQGTLNALTLGGHSTVTMPPLSAVLLGESNRVSWESTWIPWDLPTETGWALTTGGGGSELLNTSQSVTLATGFGGTAYYSQTIATDYDEGVIVHADFICTAGTSFANTSTGVYVRIAESSPAVGWEFTIKATTTHLQFRDVIAGTVLDEIELDGSAFPDMADGIQVLCVFQGSALNPCFLRVWLAPRGPTESVDWTLALPRTALTSDGGAAGTSSWVRWGHFSAGLASSESDWYAFNLAYGGTVGAFEALTYFENPTDLQPIPLSTISSYIADGASVRGVSGPAYMGDSFSLAAQAEFAIEHGDIASDPALRHVWRSVDDQDTVDLAWLADGQGRAYGEVSEALYLTGCNWRFAELFVHDGSTWSSLGTIDMAEGLASCPYLRAGSTITVDPTGISFPSEWVDRNELVGGTVSLGSGKYRKIIKNTEGTWRPAGRRIVITLEGVDGTEPTSGTCSIWAPSALIIRHNTNEIRRKGYRLRIAAQDTADGFFSAKWLVGSVVPFATHPDSASDREISAPVEEIEQTDGTTYRRSLGPARRQLSWTWADGVPEYEIGGAAPTPQVAEMTSSSGALVGAAAGAEGRVLEGLVRELEGLSTPVVAALHVPSGPPNLLTINRRRYSVPVQIQGPITIQEVQGAERGASEEYTGKLVRIGAVTMRELV